MEAKKPKFNNFMIDVKRPGMEIIQALADKKVMICQRMFPICPNHVRVGVGPMEEMAKIQQGVSRGNGLIEVAVG